MRQILCGIFLVSFAALTTELTLIRVFDVILTANTSYMIVTCALFAFGVAGVWRVLRPLPAETNYRAVGARLSLLFAASVLLILPVSNALPLNYREILDHPLQQMLAFSTLYIAVSLPFFFVGLLLSSIFTAYSYGISRLYFWDLAGAALGCLIVAPAFPYIGPGGLLVVLSGAGCLAAAFFIGQWRSSRWWMGLAGVLVLVPIILPAEMLEFRQHMNKRGIKIAAEEGRIEFSRWDPISKIDVYDSGDYIQDGKLQRFKHVGYDGGQQSSYIYPFDGNFQALREDVENRRVDIERHFWFAGVLASHHLKADSGQRVLVIGSAGGQETKAALMYGAAQVDAVEMVGSVVELGTGKYREYNGGIFTDPRVHVMQGEGRSFLRGSNKRYDIIQIFSNHTSSSIASGSGAIQSSYLQTAEAYQEYFEHLTENGVLHINHHVFPKMITTAALAWKRLGRTDFRAHVAVWQRPGEDNLPTMLIKMQPWTAEELARLEGLFRLDDGGSRLVENPLSLEDSFLSAGFYDGTFPEDLEALVPYRVAPSTDDNPYFNFLRRHIGLIEADPRQFLDEATAFVLNSQMKGPIPFDQVHLYVTGAAGLFFAVLVILLPLAFSRAGRISWPGRNAVLIYFACLGGGFIIIELIFIQIFMRLIGSPLHTYTAVMMGMLLSAALGSLSTPILRVMPKGFWALPFIGTAISILLFLLLNEPVTQLLLAAPLAVRILATVALIAPVGFFLGMPFPLGIVALEGAPAGAIAWAWAMNSIFTVIGAIASVVLSLFIGFYASLIVALTIYGVGLGAFSVMRQAAKQAKPLLTPEALNSGLLMVEESAPNKSIAG